MAIREIAPEYLAQPAATKPARLLLDNLELWTGATRAKSTSGRGSNRKMELTGIKKLRELILELAVRGKLVPQNPDDEPASALLRKIEAEKARLVAKGRLRAQKTLPAVGAEEIPFELPEGWEWVRFGNITFNRDSDRIPLSVSERENRRGEYDYYGASGVIDSIDDYLFDKPLLLIGEDGANLINRSTPIAFMARGKYWVNNHAHVIDGINEDFLMYVGTYINSISLEPYVTGTAQPKMNQAKMNSIPLALPPFAEQQRILKKIDELMALCDQLEQRSEHQLDAHQRLVETLLATLTQSSGHAELVEAWQRLADHFDLLFSGALGGVAGADWAIDRLKDCILQLAAMGKLVPQNPDDEPASTLLARIEAEKVRLVRDGKLKKQKPLPPIGEEEMPFEIPEGWSWARLQSVFLKITDGTHHSPPNGEIGDYLYISAKNIKENGVQLSNATYVTKEIHKEIYSRCNPEQGDILYIKDGATTGITTINNLDAEFSMLSSVALLKTSKTNTNTSFLLQSLRSPFFYNEMRGEMTGVAITRVTLKKLETSLVGMPPLPEQHRIVAKVDELFALCDQLKARLQAVGETQLQLTDALVEQALA